MGEKIKDSTVRVWEQTVEIPTYGVGEPDRNPMFLEKRVYQGSSGRVYPYPVIDKIFDEKSNQPYKIVFMENEYLQIQIMPEVGGRIYRAVDKTNNYDFVYYNRVIKPALVGLAGPWISGGIELNWPQHHRPNTFGPVAHRIVEHEDGSITVWVSEIDRMYGTKGMAGYTLYPGKAYLEIKGQLYNRTPYPQTFLWWANPAVAVNDDTESIFPPDVTAVFDHGKRDVSRFPIATGTYYKVDYSAGVDISRYKNIPVPTSYMAYKSDYDFVGGYDYGKQAGILHIANHHIAPGKKQWTWGNSEFGKAWDRNLTDEDGPYVELMTGVFTDNQPDFSWLHPNEEKVFSQYFMPYKEIGAVKNATVDAALNVEFEAAGNGLLPSITVSAYTTSVTDDAVIEVKQKGATVHTWTVSLSPEKAFVASTALLEDTVESDVRVTIRNALGLELVSYQAAAPTIARMPDPAKPIGEPQSLPNTEALYLAGLHLEQYRHATYAPEDYYLEGLKRDPGDIRLNNAMGLLKLRSGLLEEAERHFMTAVATATRHNPNPRDGEPFYNLGLALKAQDKLTDAFAAFYKSVWNTAFQDTGFLELAAIACREGRLDEALQLAERALMRNVRGLRVRGLIAAVHVERKDDNRAIQIAQETIVIDRTDVAAHHQLARAHASLGDARSAEQHRQELGALFGRNLHHALALTQEYAEAGLWEHAIDLLYCFRAANPSTSPMYHYSLGYLYAQLGKPDQALTEVDLAAACSPDYCLPNTLWDYRVLKAALDVRPGDAFAHYYLGNWLYDKKRWQDAIAAWSTCARLKPDFPTAHRNLALAYYNKLNDATKAKAELELAFSLRSTDARVLFELDQLYKKIGKPPEERLSHLQPHIELVRQRDDLLVEWITLHNRLGHYEAALDILTTDRFHPWEGGEGKVTGQYVTALLGLGQQRMVPGGYGDAIRLFTQALHYPDNLGEGKLYGAQENHVYYYLGCAYDMLGDTTLARRAFERASEGLDQPASAMFYNDQPPETIFFQGMALLRLGCPEDARRRFNKLVDYGEKHLFDDVKIDYFAVSLPDFLVFDEDLNRRNAIHCRYMIGLGCYGLGDVERARMELRRVLHHEPGHQGAWHVLTWHVEKEVGSDQSRLA